MDLISSGTILFVWTIAVLLILILPVLALISILKNRFKDNDKLIWVLVVLLLPFFGSLIYFTMGRSKRLIKY